MSRDGSPEVARILARLRSDLTDKKLPSKEHQQLLEQLKVLGRKASNSQAIFAKPGIETLCKYAFASDSLPVSREAMRCLANAMLLNESSRQILVDLGYDGDAADRLKEDDRDDEFLASRIVFLLTYNTTVDLQALVRDHSLATSICNHIARHAKKYASTSPREQHPMEDMALSETQKLLFNITAKRPDLVPDFSPGAPDLFTIASALPLATPPLEPPLSTTLNALLNLDLTLAPCATTPNATLLTSVLSAAIKTYPESTLDQTAMPLLALLRRLHAAAPPEVKQSLRETLLPSASDRTKPLGQGDALPARLLRLTASPALPTLRDNISALLFELSDSDPALFVQNIGYGYAAGYLATHKLAVPQSAMSGTATNGSSSSSNSSSNTATSSDPQNNVGVNPVTGQRWDAEPVFEGPDMTDEEKEREAERLFVLFERLRATGVVDVENPVRRAVEEGRFEELD